jgi:hypothetical protein
LSIVPKSKKPPRPVTAEKFFRVSIWKIQVITAAALAFEGVPKAYLDYLSENLINALRASADQIEQAMQERRNGGQS